MAAGGAHISWDGAGNITYLGIVLASGDRIATTTESFTLTFWGSIKGNKPGTSTSSEGHVFLFLQDSVIGPRLLIRATDADNTFQSSPFTVVPRYMDTTFAQADVGTTGDNVDTDENWFFGVTWNHTTGVLTVYRVIDEGTLASDATAGSLPWLQTIDEIRFGAYGTNSAGGNLEVRNVKLWVGSAFDSTGVDAERNSEAPVSSSGLVADWRIPSTSDYTNTYAGGGALASLSATVAGTGTITNGSMDPVDIQAAAATRRVFIIS